MKPLAEALPAVGHQSFRYWDTYDRVVPEAHFSAGGVMAIPVNSWLVRYLLLLLI